MEETWAFFNSGFHDAATNMAIDEMLLNWHSEGRIPPVIRFYGWKHPSLSVGHFQNEAKTIDFNGIRKHGCEFVRRLTGGSAVLHDHEVTYSIIVSEDHPNIPHSVNEAYYVLADGLLKAYRKLGIDAEFARPRLKRGDERTAVCFETPAIYEMLVDGKKISGNAQTRRKGVLLQHGSLPISFDTKMLFDLFRFSSEKMRDRQREKFSRKATSIQEQIGKTPDYDQLVPVFLEGFRESLHIATEEFVLPDSWWAEIIQLRDTKYASDTWNERKKKTARS